MKRTSALITSLLLLAAGAAAAAEPEKVTLQEAVRRGLERNNQVRASRFQSDAATAAATAASLHYLPALQVEESWSRSNLPVNTFMMKLNQGRFDAQQDMLKLNNPAPVSDFRTLVTIEQPLLVPAAWAGRKAARHGAGQQKALEEQTRQQIGFEIFQQYLEVQKQHAGLQFAEKALEEARESLRQAAVRTAAGLGLKSDELRAATHQAAMEQQLISARNNLTLARMRLAVSTGAPAGEQLEQAAPVVLPDPSVELHQLVIKARQERRDLQAVEQGRERAEAALLQTRSGFLPTIGAFGSWEMHDNSTLFGRDHDAWSAGVSLRWNLFDGFRTWQGDRRSRAELAAANEQLEQARREVSFQVHESWLRRDEAAKRRDVAQSAVQAAEETARLISKRFDNALATMVELLDAQTALNQARASLVEAEAGLVLATGRVYHSAGILLKELH